MERTDCYRGGNGPVLFFGDQTSISAVGRIIIAWSMCGDGSTRHSIICSRFKRGFFSTKGASGSNSPKANTSTIMAIRHIYSNSQISCLLITDILQSTHDQELSFVSLLFLDGFCPLSYVSLRSLLVLWSYPLRYTRLPLCPLLVLCQNRSSVTPNLCPAFDSFPSGPRGSARIVIVIIRHMHPR